MHDNRIEDVLRSVLRAEGDSPTLTVTAQELDRRLVLRRQARTGRRVSLIAAAIAVIAVAGMVAISNGWLRQPPVGSQPGGVASPIPSAAAGACDAIDPAGFDQPPSLLMTATPGDAIGGYGGALGAFRIGDRRAGEAGGWIHLAVDAVETVPAGRPTERLRVMTSGATPCLGGVTADAIPFGQAEGPSLALAVTTGEPAASVEVAQPAEGNWLIRIHVQFMTSDRTDAWSETFFHVLVRANVPSTTAPPTALPTLLPPAGSVLVDASSPSDRPGATTGDTTETIAGQVPPRDAYRVDIACLGSSPLRWSIGHEGRDPFLTASDRACDGIVSTTTVELGTPTTDLDVVVQGDPGTAWHVVVSSIAGRPAFLAPILRMWPTNESATNGTEAFGRCVNHGSTSDQCAAPWYVLDGAPQVLIAAGSSLSFALDDGWRIGQARITAAAVDLVRANVFVSEYSIALRDKVGARLTIPVKLGPGAWIVRVSLNASKDGDTFDAYYDLPLNIGS